MTELVSIVKVLDYILNLERATAACVMLVIMYRYVNCFVFKIKRHFEYVVSHAIALCVVAII